MYLIEFSYNDVCVQKQTAWFNKSVCQKLEIPTV